MLSSYNFDDHFCLGAKVLLLHICLQYIHITYSLLFACTVLTQQQMPAELIARSPGIVS